MVKNKLIPITVFLAASFMFGSASLFAAENPAHTDAKEKTHYEEAKKEHTQEKENHETNKDNHYEENINKYGDTTVKAAESLGLEYVEVELIERPDYEPINPEPIAYIPQVIERPNIVSRVNEVNNIRIDGYIPQIVGMNARAAERINASIQDSFLNLVNMGHREIRADFDVHNWGGMTSLVVRYQMAGERQVVHTFVFDNVTKTEVTLRNLLGRDFVSYINNRITNELRADDNGNAHSNITNFRTIRANQNFYVKDGNIHILFEQARVAHERYGVVEFVMPINTLSYTLAHNQFVIENGKVFVPATVARRFGMDVHIERGGTMHIRDGQRAVTVDVHNERKNPNDVTYINGYDVALSAEFLYRELGISVEQVPNSREVIVSHRFER